MKPQAQGHVMDIPYNQDDLKPDGMLMNKERSPSKYQDGDNMSYSEKEALKQIPKASSWPKFSDVQSIPDYCITARLNTEFKGHASIWYTEMKEIHGGSVKLPKSTAMVLGYGKRTCHTKMKNTQWTKIHMSSVSDISKHLKPFILK
ncbi:hypothetical protein O181_041454 [Austropuccinia psidii MF-1]|uniref:Uncharacterized protein n=1 Tax=Austropuccinia psidii MF-1 TaxID=1389203 RepID=A0A9Q3DE80_9BASI|nr:hypothetical protein [Austropuccinia psidii MF-1]